jgi:anti-sigma factor RsiW
MTAPGPPSDDLGERDELGELLSALLDGELTPSERARVDAHLDAHPGARADLEALSATRALLRGLPWAEPPTGALAAIADAVARSGVADVRYAHAANAKTARRAAAWIAAAAAAAAIATGLTLPSRQHPVTPAVGDLARTHGADTSDGAVPALASFAVPVDFSAPAEQP